MSSLRPYQTQIIEESRALMQSGIRRLLITAPTGSGKTLLTAHMLKNAAAKGMDSVFNVHRRELVKQSTRAFSEVGVSHGIIAAGFMPDPRQRVQICSVPSLSRRFTKMRRPSLFVWDECHHITAGSWSKIFKAFPEAFHIGLTATPARLDGKGLNDYFQQMVHGPSVSWLIENGFLSPYRLYAPKGISVEGVRKRAGDFARDELSAAADKPTITGDAIREYFKRASGRRAVVFCVSIEHSKHVVASFNAAGVRAEHVDGETDVLTRDQAIKNFEAGRTLVLSNVDLFGEGFDLPSIEAAILLRPTASLGLHLQQLGRVLRTFPGKSCAIILDHAGNTLRHGLPDEDREWSLEGSRKPSRSGESSASVRICPKCFAAQFPGRMACNECGHTFEIKPREIEQVEGELQEVSKEQIAAQRRDRAREQGRAQSLDDLIAIGKARNYKRPDLWAKHIFFARQSKRQKVTT